MKSILYLDSDKFRCQLVEKLLQNDYEVFSYQSFEEVSGQLESLAPNALITREVLDENHFTALQSEIGTQIPVVLLSDETGKREERISLFEQIWEEEIDASTFLEKVKKLMSDT